MSARRGTRRGASPVWGLNVAMAVGAIAALVLVVRGYEPLREGPGLLWGLGLVAAFAVTERTAVHLHAGGRSYHSFTLSEIPLVLGLVFAAPFALVGARVAGAGLVLVAQRQQSRVKLVFNLLMFTLEATAAVVVHRLVLGPADALAGPRGWLAALLAAGAVYLVNAAFVPLAIALEQRRWSLEPLRRFAVAGLVSALTNTSVGMLAVILLLNQPWAVLLLVQVGVLLSLAYRAHGAQQRQLTTLQALHDFTRELGLPSEEGSLVPSLLERTRTMLRCEVAELLLHERHASEVTRTISTEGGRAERRGLRVSTVLPLWAVDRPGHVLPRGTRLPEERAYLTARGFRDAILVPLHIDEDVHAALVVADRLGEVETFGGEDLRLLQTIANHAGVTLKNERLLDRLRQEIEAKRHQALHDALTGLPNRTMFHERVQEAVLQDRGRGQGVAVMLLDLDRFKEVNDTLGHHVGDELLQQVGLRLRENVKATDTVARLGGDEFAILLRAASRAEVLAIAERVGAALEQPFQLGSLTLVVGGSVGIALAPEHGDLATVLLQRADVAMYTAKAAHGGVAVYSPERDTHSLRRLSLVGDLRNALAQGGLDVHYQPKVDVRTGTVVGAEALVRWFHPAQGPVSPEEFVTIAERTGMIHDLTAHVLTTALAQCRDWRRAGHRIDIAVNVSVSSLLNLDFPDVVRGLLDAAGVAPSSLTLEITESSIMADTARAIRVLGALSAMGVQLAIDDFGTGYSSLSQLKQLPVDELKIDRSFIMDMTSDDDDATIVRSTIDLGHNLGLRVVAEGVEDEETRMRLWALGCDLVQGYHLSRALEPHSFDLWLREWMTAPARREAGAGLFALERGEGGERGLR